MSTVNNSSICHRSNNNGYFDGCFDIMHSGHYDAFRQARNECNYLIVGVHDAKEIEKNKGCAPVQTDLERLKIVESCKWVDRAVMSHDYNPDYIQVLDQYNCKFAMHGSDVNYTPQGEDPFQEAKDAGRFKTLSRPLGGLSSTDIIARILSITTDLFKDKTVEEEDADTFLLTTRHLREFMNMNNTPQKSDKIVYVAGSFDLFHCGHVAMLEEAKKYGTFLIVGIHEDSTVKAHNGKGYPVMNLFERAMNVLGCKYVDEIIFDAPYIITKDMIKKLGISVVIQPKVDIDYFANKNNNTDVYREIRRTHGNMLKEIDNRNQLSTRIIVDRIIANREAYEDKANK